MTSTNVGGHCFWVVALLSLWTLTLGCVSDGPKEMEFNLEILDGALVGPKLIDSTRGDTVTFNVRSNENGLLHLHGYDVELILRKGNLASFVLEVEATGRFLMTLHRTMSDADSGHDHESENHKESDAHEKDSSGPEEIELGYFQVNPK